MLPVLQALMYWLWEEETRRRGVPWGTRGIWGEREGRRMGGRSHGKEGDVGKEGVGEEEGSGGEGGGHGGGGDSGEEGDNGEEGVGEEGVVGEEGRR